MKRNALILTAVLGVLCLTTSAWAGGASCSGKAEGAATKEGAHCTVAKGASKDEASAGGHCTMGKDVSKEAAAGSHCTMGKDGSMASGKCPFGANTAVFSYAVPNAHCGACVDKVQTAAMAQKGVLCAKVDLDTKMAYIAGDKNMNQQAIAKAIKNAGFTCTFKDKGPKARAELIKIMASNTTVAPKKDKV